MPVPGQQQAGQQRAPLVAVSRGVGGALWSCTIKAMIKRRSATEPDIGHMKMDGGWPWPHSGFMAPDGGWPCRRLSPC